MLDGVHRPVRWMAFPEPTPPIKRSAAKEFLERLDKFELTATQKKRWSAFQAAYKSKHK